MLVETGNPHRCYRPWQGHLFCFFRITKLQFQKNPDKCIVTPIVSHIFAKYKFAPVGAKQCPAPDGTKKQNINEQRKIKQDEENLFIYGVLHPYPFSG
jgi:hypothetical protein